MPSVGFFDLPLELLPAIFEHLLKPQHLAATCLVSKTFHSFAIPRLYKRASIYSWHKQGKTKVVQLFWTLAHSPHLARYIHRLEIRDFPRTSTLIGAEVLETVIPAIRNCVNLQSCTWTRDGSLTSSILEALRECRHLEELEINGHNQGIYDSSILSRFANMRKISVIMPSASVAARLRPWMSVSGSTLRNLTLICKSSTVITDALLESLAPDLAELEYFNITGSPKVTYTGISAILAANKNGILGLGLEGLSMKFGMEEFSRRYSGSRALRRLRSITLTIHQQTPLQAWMIDVAHLLSFAPLEIFQIYSTGAFVEASSTDAFWEKIVTAHSARLTRFSIHRMLISMSAIDDICRRCVALEQLFVVVEQDDLKTLGISLSHAKSLRTVHINYPLEAHTDAPPVISPAEALAVVNYCSPTVTQFGCNAKVWQVNRLVHVLQDGSVNVERILSPYESPDIPEPFLVVRT